MTDMKISMEEIKKLREETEAPVVECRAALENANGDMAKAKEWLKAKGLERAAKKGEREVKAGLVETYSHGAGRVGVLVEVACETDFVSRNEDFKTLAHELCLQVASMNPKDVEELLAQPWIRDDKQTIGDLVKEKIAKFGENIIVKRIARFELGCKD
jgi:elongation factor Ts